jgi:hypothetical protein
MTMRELWAGLAPQDRERWARAIKESNPIREASKRRFELPEKVLDYGPEFDEGDPENEEDVVEDGSDVDFYDLDGDE